MKSKTTQQDIASALGLSRNTVSKVFNGSDAISPKTRAAIIRTAVEMGYKHIHPDLMKEIAVPPAQAEGTVAFITRRGETFGYWSKIISGVENAVSKTGMSLVLCMVDAELEERGELPATLRNMAHKGFIATGTFPKEYYCKIKELGVPMVSIDTAYDVDMTNQFCDIILTSNSESIGMITKRLIDQGHTRIGYLGDISTSRAYLERWQGFMAAMEERGVPVDKRLCITDRDPSHYFAGDSLHKTLEAISEDITALVCGSDSAAVYAIHLLTALGKRVPDDIAVSGFDDIEEGLRCSLTTVNNYPEELGRRASEELLWRLDNRDRPYEIIRMRGSVVYRESTEKRLEPAT